MVKNRKFPQKIHQVALRKLLSETYFLLQSVDYFSHHEGELDFAPPGTDFTGQAPCITKKS